MATTKKSKITMKLLIDKSRKKVLFAEAGKESVDFLLHILSLPLGTVVKYINKASMAGSIGSIYGSLESLSVDYVQEGLNKDVLLNPKQPSVLASYDVPLLTMKPAPGANNPFYACAHNSSHKFVSDVEGVKCPSCSKEMSSELAYVSPSGGGAKGESRGGYVKGVVTYMIMDDLCVQPMSTISSIMLLNKFNVQDVTRLEEKEVILDMNMAVAMLKASLSSKTVLTDVFLPKKIG